MLRPEAGAVVRHGHGGLEWHDEGSWTDEVDWTEALAESPKQNWTAYAYTTVRRAAAGAAVLAIGSSDSIRVWLNGELVHEVRAPRRFMPDEDHVVVDMKAGDNRLLVRAVHTAGPSQFAVRVLESGALVSRGVEIGPSIVSAESTARALVVKTDTTTDPGKADVTVEVVGAGGRVVGTNVAPRGAQVVFDPTAWPDGAYEVRCSTRTLAGAAWATHFPWYKGDSVGAARRLLAAADRADASLPSGWTLKMLGEMVRDRLGAPLDTVAGNPWWAIHSPLLEAEELGLEMNRRDARTRPYGFVRLTYRDDVDDAVQYCRSYLPGGYDPSTRWPLIVFLHGYNPPNPEYINWWDADSRHPSFGDNSTAIVLEPHGRGNVGYLGLGASDVLKCIQLAKERFRVDEDRVYLTGESMGGGGAWEVGTSHPELFAAIAPIFGGWDYHVQLGEAERSKLSPAERFQRERESSFARAESLLNTPVFVQHGDSDRTVDVEGSRYAVRLLERWGYDVRYREHPDKDHEDLKISDELVAWFLRQKRDPAPSHVRVHSADLATAAAYWVRVERSQMPLAFVVVDAEIVAPNLVRLDSDNVASIELSPRGRLIDPTRPLKVVWNGAPARSIELRDGRASLDAEEYKPVPVEKTPELPGTLFDLFRTPFAVVVGTISPDPAMRDRCAQKGRDFVHLWQSWQHQTPRVFQDTQISDAQAERYSLLLLGGAAENRVTQILGERLPLHVTDRTVAIDGHSFDAQDAVVQLVYPSPFNSARYVEVVAATSEAGMYFWFPSGNWFGGFSGDRRWDFSIRDGRDASGTKTRFSERMRIASGLFDQSWRYREAAVVRGDEAFRSSIPLTTAPRAIELAPALYDEYVGHYRADARLEVSIARDDRRLIAQLGQLAPSEAIPYAHDEFFVEGDNIRIAFRRDSGGRVESVAVRYPAEEIIASRVVAPTR
jgi:dienelactone hydrolase